MERLLWFHIMLYLKQNSYKFKNISRKTHKQSRIFLEKSTNEKDVSRKIFNEQEYFFRKIHERIFLVAV